jgi:L-2,4-diaminobutyrate decarboxylase
VPLPVDKLGRIDVARLPAAVAAVRERGRRPVALVANACATATGLYDRLTEIGPWCAAEGIWLHVDGAHGASALLSPRLRSRLAGLEHANSLIWDTHKMLRTSALCTGVLVRAADQFDGLFRQDASYLFHPEAADADMGQRTFETSKPPLGLNLFLNLAYRGEATLREYVEAQHDKAEFLWQLLQERDDFDCPFRPESNILCFRYTGGPDRQLEIRDRLRQRGRFYLSSARLSDATYLRAAVMSPATDERALRDLVDEIVRTAREL